MIRKFVFSALMLCFPLIACAQSQLGQPGQPIPPCGKEPVPAYARPDAPPNVRTLSGNELESWVPADCTAWPKATGGLLIALAGSFRFGGTSDELLARFGAVSGMRGAHYWSVTDKDWRILITEASALRTPDPETRRSDFSARELETRKDAFFSQTDTRSTSEVVYRMRVRDQRPTRLVLETENVTSVRWFFVSIFEPQELKSLYFLERLAGGLWGYYQLVSANTVYARGNEASFINRTAALFQHAIGIQPESVAPLAR